jgi:hypothetical protein
MFASGSMTISMDSIRFGERNLAAPCLDIAVERGRVERSRWPGMGGLRGS